MQNAMAELMGPKAAEVMARGLSRLTPWDLSGRVALNKLILPDVQEGLQGKEWAESAMAAALGPVAGIGINNLSASTVYRDNAVSGYSTPYSGGTNAGGNA